MSFLRFGKKIKNRTFDYIPKYYDQDKEELEKRLKRYKPQPGDTELTKQRIRGGFRRKYNTKDEYVSRSQKRSNLILVATLIILIILTYVFLSEYLPRIVATFE